VCRARPVVRKCKRPPGPPGPWCLVHRFRKNIAIDQATDRSSSLYFERKTAGVSLDSRRYRSIRAFNSPAGATRIPPRKGEKDSHGEGRQRSTRAPGLNSLL
jgi:hypothetical protein